LCRYHSKHFICQLRQRQCVTKKGGVMYVKYGDDYTQSTAACE